MSLLIKMRQIKDLSPSERHIVDYIFDNLPEVINIGIVDLSKKTNTSTTTVKRLCQKLGINSYIDFRLELSMELSNYIKNSIIKGAKEPVRRYDSVADIIKKVSNQNAKSVLESTNINDSELVETIVKLMKSCRRIDWYGVGPSNVVAVDAAIKCMRLGIETSSYNNRMQMMVNAKACSCQDTMAFLVSYTGETTEILEVAHQLVMKNDGCNYFHQRKRAVQNVQILACGGRDRIVEQIGRNVQSYSDTQFDRYTFYRSDEQRLRQLHKICRSDICGQQTLIRHFAANYGLLFF